MHIRLPFPKDIPRDGRRSTSPTESKASTPASRRNPEDVSILVAEGWSTTSRPRRPAEHWPSPDNDLLREIVTKTLIKRKVVLISHDDQPTSLVLTLCSGFQFRVHSVADGREAVQAVHECPYDIIVMDIQVIELYSRCNPQAQTRRPSDAWPRRPRRHPSDPLVK